MTLKFEETSGFKSNKMRSITGGAMLQVFKILPVEAQLGQERFIRVQHGLRVFRFASNRFVQSVHVLLNLIQESHAFVDLEINSN